MAKVTREQFNKWNAKLMNDFRFDLHYFMTHNEKTAVKELKLADGRTLRAKLEFMEEREGWTTLGHRPVMHLSVWKECESNSNFMTSSGVGVFVKLSDEISAKRNYALLCKLSGTISDTEILALANHHMGQLNNPFVFGA